MKWNFTWHDWYKRLPASCLITTQSSGPENNSWLQFSNKQQPQSVGCAVCDEFHWWEIDARKYHLSDSLVFHHNTECWHVCVLFLWLQLSTHSVMLKFCFSESEFLSLSTIQPQSVWQEEHKGVKHAKKRYDGVSCRSECQSCKRPPCLAVRVKNVLCVSDSLTLSDLLRLNSWAAPHWERKVSVGSSLLPSKLHPVKFNSDKSQWRSTDGMIGPLRGSKVGHTFLV